jgi:hypothetical protein
MLRTLACSLAGAATGFLVGFLGMSAILSIAEGGDKDTLAASLFVGVFLTGAGAIAGAVIGGVADLLAYNKKNE